MTQGRSSDILNLTILRLIPSPFLYNNTMYTMAGLVTMASALHFMVKPVDQKYFEPEKKD